MSRAPLWAILLIAPPLSLAAQAWQATRAPDAADLQCATKTIRADWAEGDVVRFDPVWAHEAWPAIKDLDVEQLPATDPQGVGTRKRLWILASFSSRGRQQWPHGWTVQDRTQCGDAEVVLLQLPPLQEVIYDFEEHLKDAQMSLLMDGPGEHLRFPSGAWVNLKPPRYRCYIWEKGRHNCVPNHAWNWVGPRMREIDDVVRTALWAHPPVGGHKLDLTYPAVAMGRSLEVEGGQTLAAVRSPMGTPIHFEVYVAGERRLERVVRLDEKGWFRWSIDTTAEAGTTVQVRFRVYAENDNHMRQWMFSARTIR